MLSIRMYVCETQEEAASVVASLSEEDQSAVTLMQVTTGPEALHLICDLTPGTSTLNASGAIATSLETLLSTALDLLLDTEPSSSMH